MNDITTPNEPYSTSCLVLQELPIHWKWMFFLGIFMIIAGTFGLYASGLLTLTSIFMLGSFIFVGGILQIIHTIQAKEKDWGGKLQHILIALLYIIAGVIIFFDPLTTSLALTILLAFMFALMGITKIWYAFYCKKQDWKWLLPAFSGLLNLIFTGFIIATLPESALWLIGMLIALEMLFNGWFLLLLGLRVRKIEKVKSV